MICLQVYIFICAFNNSASGCTEIIVSKLLYKDITNGLCIPTAFCTKMCIVSTPGG